MAHRDEGSNPFGWVVLGFICGVIATLGVLIVYSGGLDSSAGEDAEPSAAESAYQPDAPTDAPVVARPRPADIPEAAAPAVAPPAAAPAGSTPSPAYDPQVAEDAAASGMTSRSPRN